MAMNMVSNRLLAINLLPRVCTTTNRCMLSSSSSSPLPSSAKEGELEKSKKVGSDLVDLKSEPKSLNLFSGQINEDLLGERQVRISKPSKNVMQSGTAYTNTWKIEFNSEKRWENWLMGWTSSGDPLSNLSLTFPSKEEAIAFCNKNQLQWFVEEQPERKIRKKSYADNFSWNKRTRLGSK